MREYGSQAVVWQTALNPVVALELLAEGAWSGTGVLGPEAFPAQPFLDKLAELRLAARRARARAVAASAADRRATAALRRGRCVGCRDGARPPARTALGARRRPRARRSRARRCRRCSWRSRQRCPAISGWVLDERRAIRQHVNVYVNGQLAQEETAVGDADRVHVLRRSQEGEMTELLVGTKKGLFVLDGDVGAGFEVTARAFPGQSVEYAMRDPRSGRYLASVTSWFYGGRIWVDRRPGRRVAGGRGHGAARGRRRVARADLGDRRGRGRRAALRGRRSRAACSRATTAGSPGRSTAASGTTRRAPTGRPAAAASACTRSSPGPATPTG